MISVVIPVYNVERYLETCLESIRRQTCTEFEVILVDDGSQDNSGAICDAWAQQDCRFRVVHQSNQGVSAARNRGFAESRGEYLLFLDPDDDIEETMLAELYGAFSEEGGEQIDLVCCRYCRILPERTVHFPMKDRTLSQREALAALLGDLSFFNAVWNKMIRREALLDENGAFIPFPEEIAVGEDSVWTCRVLLGCRRIRCIDRELYHWYYRADSATGSKAMTRRYLTKIDAQSRLMELLHPYDRELFHRAHRRFLGVQRNCMAEAYAKGETAYQKELWEQMKREVRVFYPNSFHDICFLGKYAYICYLVWRKKDGDKILNLCG